MLVLRTLRLLRENVAQSRSGGKTRLKFKTQIEFADYELVTDVRNSQKLETIF